MDEQAFKEKLTPEQYRVMRQKGTETPFVGKHWDGDDHGLYACAACDRVLFSSLQKFDAGTGWPSFYKPLRKKHIELYQDDQGQEARCAHCHSHLGYLITDEKAHYRVNSVGLNFMELGDIEFPEEEDNEKQEQEQQQGNQPKSFAKNITLTIGGLAIGIAAGVSAAPAAPTPMCMPAPSVQMPTARVTKPVPTKTATPTTPAGGTTSGTSSSSAGAPGTR